MIGLFYVLINYQTTSELIAAAANYSLSRKQSNLFPIRFYLPLFYRFHQENLTSSGFKCLKTSTHPFQRNAFIFFLSTSVKPAVRFVYPVKCVSLKLIAVLKSPQTITPLPFYLNPLQQSYKCLSNFYNLKLRYYNFLPALGARIETRQNLSNSNVKTLDDCFNSGVSMSYVTLLGTNLVYMTIPERPAFLHKFQQLLYSLISYLFLRQSYASILVQLRQRMSGLYLNIKSLSKFLLMMFLSPFTFQQAIFNLSLVLPLPTIMFTYPLTLALPYPNDLERTLSTSIPLLQYSKMRHQHLTPFIQFSIYVYFYMSFLLVWWDCFILDINIMAFRLF